MNLEGVEIQIYRERKTYTLMLGRALTNWGQATLILFRKYKDYLNGMRTNQLLAESWEPFWTPFLECGKERTGKEGIRGRSMRKRFKSTEFEQSHVCGVSMDLATIPAANNADGSHALISMQTDSNSFKSPMLPIEFYPPRREKNTQKFQDNFQICGNLSSVHKSLKVCTFEKIVKIWWNFNFWFFLMSLILPEQLKQ